MKLRLAFIIGILSLAFLSGFTVVIGDTNDSQYDPIESADDNPEVRENGAFRLLASNDVDEDETETHPDVFNVSARATQMRVAGTNDSSYIIRIDDTTFTTEQARQYSRLTDGYREVLYTDTRIPTNDSWQSGSEVTIEDASFIGFAGNETDAEHSGEDGVVYVEIESEPGQLPARNVSVLAEDTPDDEPPGDLYIANPNNIDVYNGSMENYEDINRQAVESSFLETGINKSVVPAAGYGDNTARYEVQNATISGEWHSDEVAIKDHYVGIARITEGAIYDDYWVVNPDRIEVTTLHDYRAVIPYTPDNQYTEDAPQCSYDCGDDTCYATPERYEYYENPTVTNEFMELYHNGSWYSEGDQTHVFPISDPASGMITPYSTVTVEYDHTYGVDYPSECSESDWENTDPNEVTSTIYRNAEHPIEPADATNLTITAYIKDTNGGQELYFDIVGDQRPEENPLGRMQLTANDGQDVWTVYSPWIAFPQTLYDRVETRQESINNWNYTSVEIGEAPHNLHRDYLDAASYKSSAKSSIIIRAERIDQAQTYEGINVGENVINSKGDVPLYRTIGGPVYATESGDFISETDAEATATDIFGNEIDVELEYVDYKATNLDIEMTDSGDGVQGQLTDPDGNGVPNRTIALTGSTQDTVTTDNNGEFQVEVHPNATTFRAEFESDKLRDNYTHHYEGSKAQLFTGNLNVNVISAPLKYLSASISNLLVVAHWIVLGLFFVWWTKFRNSE